VLLEPKTKLLARRPLSFSSWAKKIEVGKLVKKCPFCAEDIHGDAIKCKQCGE